MELFNVSRSGSVGDGGGPQLRRSGTAATPSWRFRFPATDGKETKAESQDAELGAGSEFDPMNLLDVGMGGWRDRAANLEGLLKSRSVAATGSLLKLPRNASIRSALPPLSVMQKALTKDRAWAQRLEAQIESPKISLPEEYSASLAAAPHASLIFLVVLYHHALCSHGLKDEAAKIAALLDGIREAEEAEAAATELLGVDLLLKDGLLELFLRIQPHLPPVPSQIVKFKDLEYFANVIVADDTYETFLTKTFGFLFRSTKKKKAPRKLRLLKDVTGYLMPGTLTLVLGPPASGKSSLHYVLSGKMQAGATVEGTVSYNDVPLHKITTQHLAAVVGQVNEHLPLLTVRETLEFAKTCLLAFKPELYGPELKEILGDVLKSGQDPKVELTMSMIGLKHVANRIVGSAMIPSITEDERYRLTAAETFSGAHAVYFFDQPNTVAEDSITFDLLTAIRIYTRVRQTTFLASLLQPSSEVFDLFDRVIVLNEGQLVYQGPRQDALPHFESLGYRKPKHLSTAEFLQEVSTAEGTIYLQPGFRQLTLEDFVIKYKNSPLYRDVLRIVNGSEPVQELWVQGEPPLGVEFDEYRHFKDNGVETSSYVVSGVTDVNGSLVTVSMDQTTAVQRGDRVVAFGSKTGSLQYSDMFDSTRRFKEDLAGAIHNETEPVRLQLERTFAPVKSELRNMLHKDFVLSLKEEIILLTKREISVTWRGKFGLKLRIFQVLVLSFFVGFLLFQVKNDPNQSVMNLFRTGFFVSIINMTMFNVGMLPAVMSERNIYYKQKGAHFYRPISYLLGKFFGSLPFSLCEGTLWSIIVYFLTGMTLTNGGWHFFVYYAVIIFTILNGASMVRFLAFKSQDMDRAGLYIGVLVTLFVTFAGFLMPRFEVPKYWTWFFYINPLQWAITALMLNEFNSSKYSLLCKDVPFPPVLSQCYERGDQTIGHAYLAVGQFFTGNGWIAVSLSMLFGWLVLWNFLTYLALSRIQHSRILRAGKLCREEGKSNEGRIKEEDVELAVNKLSYVAMPVTLSWHELSYDIIIPVINRPRTILNSVSGWGDSGDLVAFLGSEPGGTTALLNCLAGRKVLTERIGGQILVNSYPKDQKTFRHVLGYVDKIDAYTPYLTVRETVAYSAALRLGKSASKQKQDYFVEEVLRLTELTDLRDMLVVSLTNDVTFDQEKRLAIAAELVANPSVLFLDNPTKGLDSASATGIMSCLQQIAKTGRLVIVTLNYPSQRVLCMLSKAQILKAGGDTVYFGDVGKDGELIRTYFEAIPGSPLCPPNKTVSAYAIGLVSDHRKSHRDYGFEYRVSELALRNHVHLQQLRRSKGQNGPMIQMRSYGASWFVVFSQTFMTIQRQYWRNVNYSWGRMIGFTITSVILGSIFYKLDVTTTPGMNSRAGAIFVSCVLLGISNAQNAIPQVLQARAVHLRERAIHQLSVLDYNIAYTLAEIPYLMVSTLIYCSIFLPMANIALQSVTHFFKFWFILLEFYVVVTFFGSFLAVVSPMPAIASVLVPIVIGMWISTSGLVIPRTRILKVFIWVFYTNPLQYALDGLQSLAFYCDIQKPLCLDSNRNPNCKNDTAACPLCDCPRLKDTPYTPNVFVWSQISMIRSLDYSWIPYDMVALLLFAILFRVLTLIAFKYMKHYRRT